MGVSRPQASSAPTGRGDDSQDDAALMRRLARGELAAGGVLVERHQAMVRRFLLRLTGRADRADDLAQDTFVRMIRYAGRFDPAYSLRTWLLTIARRLSINQARGDGRVIGAEPWDWTDDQPPPHESVDRQDESDHLRRKLDAAIRQLSPAQRQALLLFHQQELTVQEVARVMEVPIGTVKSHLHRARAAMRKILGPMPQEQPR
jgi:RNA polymerase sigma-70 factor (ECF subfamily)